MYTEIINILIYVKFEFTHLVFSLLALLCRFLCVKRNNILNTLVGDYHVLGNFVCKLHDNPLCDCLLQLAYKKLNKAKESKNRIYILWTQQYSMKPMKYINWSFVDESHFGTTSIEIHVLRFILRLQHLNLEVATFELWGRDARIKRLSIHECIDYIFVPSQMLQYTHSNTIVFNMSLYFIILNTIHCWFVLYIFHLFPW